MKRKFLLMALSVFLLSSFAFAQSDDVPQAIREAFTKQYPNAENVEYKDNLLNVWVNFTLNGDKMKANYKKDGQWENTEKDWSYDKLPAAVQDGFKKSKYADREIEETKVIYRAGSTERYRLKVKKNALQKKYIFFNDQGRLVDDDITI